MNWSMIESQWEIADMRNVYISERQRCNQLVHEILILKQNLKQTNDLLKSSNFSFLLFLNLYKELESLIHFKSINKDSLRTVLEKFNVNSFNLEIDQKEEQVGLNNELIAVF